MVQQWVRHSFIGAVRLPWIFFLEKLSLGDARAYYLSTAKNELGVVSAESAAGTNIFWLYDAHS